MQRRASDLNHDAHVVSLRRRAFGRPGGRRYTDSPPQHTASIHGWGAIVVGVAVTVAVAAGLISVWVLLART